MDFSELVKTRKSIRDYSENDVDSDTVARILEAARLAPSWANRQCWAFIVIKDKGTIAEIAAKGSGSYNSWLKKAPVIVVACGDPSLSGTRNGMDYYLVDVAIAMEHIMLQAADLGLGTCWIGGFDEKEMKRILGVPENIRVVAFTPIGHPVETPGVRAKMTKLLIRGGSRKPMEEIVHRERW